MPVVRKLLAKAKTCTAGVAAIEFAIAAPILVLVMFCTTDLGLGIYRKMQVENAAQAGAEYAVLYGFAASSISSAVTQATSFSDISASPAPSQFCGCASDTGVTTADCSSTCTGGIAPGTYVTVSAQATYTTILHYPVIPDSFIFAAQSTVRIQWPL
jgi:Flp pilus assembly protein TadG